MFYPIGKNSEKPYGEGEGGHPPPPPRPVRPRVKGHTTQDPYSQKERIEVSKNLSLVSIGSLLR